MSAASASGLLELDAPESSRACSFVFSVSSGYATPTPTAPPTMPAPRETAPETSQRTSRQRVRGAWRAKEYAWGVSCASASMVQMCWRTERDHRVVHGGDDE